MTSMLRNRKNACYFAPYPVPSGMSQIARIKHIKNDLFSQIYYPLNTLTEL